MFCDTQIINEQMVEDINNILNSGDVAGLYKNEDFEGIYMVGKGECIRKNIPLNKMNMFSCYLGRVKQNIHIVLAFSPLGDVFRTRLRMFPSLVNCCTIDWFTEWPEEALMNVAKGIIAALAEVDTDVPMVARLVGTNEVEGRRLLENSVLIPASTLGEGAQKAVAAAKAYAASKA